MLRVLAVMALVGALVSPALAGDEKCDTVTNTVEQLHQIVDQVPDSRVFVLHGNDAATVLQKLKRVFSNVPDDSDVVVIAITKLPGVPVFIGVGAADEICLTTAMQLGELAELLGVYPGPKTNGQRPLHSGTSKYDIKF